ncbi:MAG TPA: penicillin-binding protein 2 [Chitinivibrionales bacterium]|jgi:penicillin-binding protein 2|nr:penicillin-binding protein 2 [Chitinivibrionales bacterium]
MPIRSHFQDDQQERTAKSLRLSIVVAALFFILIARLFYLQVVQAQVNIRLSRENGMQLRVIKAPRGLVLDRNGQVLARNRPSYSICVLPYKVKKRSEIVKNLMKIRDSRGIAVFDSTELVQAMRDAQRRRFDPARLKEDVSMELVSIVEEHSMELPGITVETESRREYPMGSKAFHVLGYMSEIPETQFDSLKNLGYHFGDQMGKAGIERQYEDIFRGRDGQEYIEVNAYGKSLGPIKDMPRTEPVPGGNVYLTINAALQTIAVDSFPDTLKGAVVALDPRNGEVLAMTSCPSADPNIFSAAASERSKNWASIALDPNLPLNNRAIAGTYPPGSTFKLVTAAAGLVSGKITGTSRMPAPCRGAFRFGSRIAHCWDLRGHGSLDLVGAVKQSCDIYFYQLGLRLGDRIINKAADTYGLGQVTGIDIFGEKSGWLSGEEEYNRRFASRGWVWTQGLNMDMAIGQTQLVTPLQLAVLAGALGNCKFIYRPYLMKEVRASDGTIILQQNSTVSRTLNLDSVIVATLHKSLIEVLAAGGTGGRAAVRNVEVGGKTGSAQNPQGEKTHALFIGCAPADDPVIAVSAVAENAGHGGTVAAPIAGAVLRYFFSHDPEGKRIADSCAQTALADKRKPRPGD